MNFVLHGLRFHCLLKCHPHPDVLGRETERETGREGVMERVRTREQQREREREMMLLTEI